MFLSVNNIKSSSIEELSVNAATSQAVVKYIGGNTKYLYTGVDFAAIYDLVYRNVESLGAWVNTNLKSNESVTYLALWFFLSHSFFLSYNDTNPFS